MGPWAVTRSSLRMSRRVAAFCRPLRPVLLLVSFPRSWSPVIGVPGLCWLWRDVPFARHRRPVVGVLGVVLVVAGVVRLFLLSTHLRPQAVHNLPRCVSVCVRPSPPPPRHMLHPPAPTSYRPIVMRHCDLSSHSPPKWWAPQRMRFRGTTAEPPAVQSHRGHGRRVSE